MEAAPFNEISQKPHPMTFVCLSCANSIYKDVRNVTFELGTLLPRVFYYYGKREEWRMDTV